MVYIELHFPFSIEIKYTSEGRRIQEIILNNESRSCVIFVIDLATFCPALRTLDPAQMNPWPRRRVEFEFHGDF